MQYYLSSAEEIFSGQIKPQQAMALKGVAIRTSGVDARYVSKGKELPKKESATVATMAQAKVR